MIEDPGAGRRLDEAGTRHRHRRTRARAATVVTVKLLVVNAAFDIGYNKALVQQCCEWCDVLALVEAKDFRVADFCSARVDLTPGHLERGRGFGPGSCLAVNTAKATIDESYLILGCDEPKGRRDALEVHRRGRVPRARHR